MPEKIVASAAKLCYSSATITGLTDNLTDEKAASFVEMLSESPDTDVITSYGKVGLLDLSGE